jgi:hypothetical protein
MKVQSSLLGVGVTVSVAGCEKVPPNVATKLRANRGTSSAAM